MRPQLLSQGAVDFCVFSHNTVRHRVHWFWAIPRRNGENFFETESGCCLMAVWLLATPVISIGSLVVEAPFRYAFFRNAPTQRSWQNIVQPEADTDVNNSFDYTV